MSEILQVNFRMPAELKDRLERSAKKSGRSITSELVLRLERSFAQDDGDEVIGVAFDPKMLGDNIDPEKFSKAINYLFNKAIEEDMAKSNSDK